MSSIIEGYNYDIFISYRQNDNRSGWVTEFITTLQEELAATLKEPISVYFDINPHDGLLETHSVDKSLEGKLKCLIFIPIISQTYCDSKSYAWQHEFVVFNKLVKEDQFGRDIKLTSGNVASRILPIKIHDLDPEDKDLLENELGGFIRGIEFIYKEPGVNRPLKPEDNEKKNLNGTKYLNQINKVANAVKEIITAIIKHNQQGDEVLKEAVNIKLEKLKNFKPKIIIAYVIILALIVFGYFFVPKFFKSTEPLEKSIAVLPFINDSPSDSTTYFINGIMEEILNNLQTIKALRVISRNSIEQFRGPAKLTTPEIAKKLGVNYVVEGSGQKYGNKIRLRVQLIRADKESHLWAKPYEQEIKNANDIFRIQSQIAEAIAEELEAVITPQEKKIIDKIPTSNLAAYEAYLQGSIYARNFTLHDWEAALEYFEQAIKKDPQYAPAYAGICYVWLTRYEFSSASPAEATAKAMAAITKALELDSTLAEVYKSLAGIKFDIYWDWEGYESSIKKAIALNPNYADAQSAYANFLFMIGRMSEAEEKAVLALKLDPLNPLSKDNYGAVLLFTHRYSDAIKQFQEVLKMVPDNAYALAGLAVALHMAGKYNEALEAWKTYYNITFKDFVHVFDKGYAKSGYSGALTLEADTLVVQSKTKVINPTEIALVYACAGNNKRTMEMLDRAYDVHDPNVVYLLWPVYDDLRNEPRFQELARKLKVPYK